MYIKTSRFIIRQLEKDQLDDIRSTQEQTAVIVIYKSQKAPCPSLVSAFINKYKYSIKDKKQHRQLTK